MAPLFTLIADPARKLLNLHVAETLKKYYPFTVDGVNYQPLNMKNKYAGSNSKFFCCDMDEWLMIDLETVDLIPPSFLLTFDKGDKVTKKQWLSVLKWVKGIFEGGVNDELQEEIEKLIPKPVDMMETITLAKQHVPSIENEKRDYLFCYEEDKDFDRCLLQVDKPYTDLPYTVVIRNFSKRGFVPFFTALYVCSSWGVCSKDHEFLTILWNHLGMKKDHGELNLEKRLKENIERCTPSEGNVPEAEPEVYRRSIQEVKASWSAKQKRIEEELKDCKIMRIE